MIDLEKTLLDICLPLVDDQKALSVKTMATTMKMKFYCMYMPTAKMLQV